MAASEILSDSGEESTAFSQGSPAAAPDFARYGMTMSREEYFSRERYVSWCNHLSCEFGRTVSFPTGQLVLTSSGSAEYKKAVIYEVPAEIEGKISAFLPGDYVFYYQVRGDLYQVFYPDNPDCETRLIFSSEEPVFFWFLSNYRVLIGYESRAFREALARVNETGIDEILPQQHDWYVLDTRDGNTHRLPDGKNYSVMTEEERALLFPIEEEEEQ